MAKLYRRFEVNILRDDDDVFGVVSRLSPRRIAHNERTGMRQPLAFFIPIVGRNQAFG